VPLQEYYGEVLKKKEDLKTSACTASGRPNDVVVAALTKVPDEVLSKFYGCGTPIPMGIEGLRVLDLGCGSGRDCYVAAALVGAGGSVTGLDMTKAQLEVRPFSFDSYMLRKLGPSGPPEGSARDTVQRWAKG
jgi:arsenite methyltransferase